MKCLFRTLVACIATIALTFCSKDSNNIETDITEVEDFENLVQDPEFLAFIQKDIVSIFRIEDPTKVLEFTEKENLTASEQEEFAFALGFETVAAMIEDGDDFISQWQKLSLKYDLHKQPVSEVSMIISDTRLEMFENVLFGINAKNDEIPQVVQAPEWCDAECRPSYDLAIEGHINEDNRQREQCRELFPEIVDGFYNRDLTKCFVRNTRRSSANYGVILDTYACCVFITCEVDISSREENCIGIPIS